MKLRVLLFFLTILFTKQLLPYSDKVVLMHDELRTLCNLMTQIWRDVGYTPANDSFIKALEHNATTIPSDILLGGLQDTNTLLQELFTISQNADIKSFQDVITQLTSQLLTQLQESDQSQMPEMQETREALQEVVIEQKHAPTETLETSCTGTKELVEACTSTENLDTVCTTRQDVQASRGRSLLNIARGTIKSDGTIVSGAGFSVNQASTGVYHITFDNAFSDAHYQMLVTPSEGLNRRISVTNASTQAATISLCDDAGTPVAQQFNFLALGN